MYKVLRRSSALSIWMTLIFSRNAEEHKRHVRTILRALDRAGMILNLDKQVFLQPRSTSCLISLTKTAVTLIFGMSIRSAIGPPPAQLQGFFNFASHYQKFIPRFSETAFTDLMKVSPATGPAISWGEREETAFQALKSAPSPNRFDPDSSQFTPDAVVPQQHFSLPNSNGKPRLHLESKKLTETKSLNFAQEQDFLAAKYALEH